MYKTQLCNKNSISNKTIFQLNYKTKQSVLQHVV